MIYVCSETFNNTIMDRVNGKFIRDQTTKLKMAVYLRGEGVWGLVTPWIKICTSKIYSM